MDIISQALERFSLFWLVWARVSGFAFAAPVLGNRAVPVAVRVGIALLFSLALMPIVAIPPSGVPQGLAAYVAAFAGDLVMGLAMGFLVALVLASAQVAGQILDAETGLNLMNIIDPVFGQPLPLLGNLFQLLAALVFLVIDGHHMVLAVLAESFRQVPAGMGLLTPEASAFGIQQVSWMFLAAVRVAAPVLGALFLVTVAMAFLARTAPQLNVFMLSVQAKLAVALFMLAVAVPVCVAAIWGLFPEAYRMLGGFLRLVGGAGGATGGQQ